MEYRRVLGHREVLVSSWLREGPLIKDASYHCVAEASTGNDMSEVDLRLTVGGIWACSLYGWLWSACALVPSATVALTCSDL